MDTDCVYVMCVWGGVRRAIDKHFKVGKMQPLWNQVPDDESTLNKRHLLLCNQEGVMEAE